MRMSASTIRIRITSAVVMGLLLTAAAWAQETPNELVAGMTNFAQASGEMPPTPLTSDQEQQVLDAVFSRFPNVDAQAMMGYIGEHFPDEMQRYTLTSMQNLGEAMTMLIGLVREGLALQELETRNPAQYARTVRQQQLERRVRAIGEARGRGTEAISKETLQQTLAEAFEAKQEMMRGDIAEIQRQVDELDALLRAREKNREAIIARRLAEMTGSGGQEW